MLVKLFVGWVIVSTIFTLFLWKGIADMNGEPDYDSSSES